VRNPFIRRHPFGEEELSSYLDRRLPPSESTRLEEHLASCEACRRRLEGLQAVVEELRALPSVPAPRSFALRPDQVEAPGRQTPVRPTTWARRTVRFAPAGVATAALLVFLVLLGVDVGTLGGGGGPGTAASLRSAKGAYESGQALGAAPAPTPAPALAAPAPSDEGRGVGTPEPTVGAPTPTEAPAPVAPPAAAEKGGGTGHWVLRGFQGLAGAAFLASVALLWRRRRAARI
jgi:hypothetical protein